jgi:hypothetical protein
MRGLSSRQRALKASGSLPSISPNRLIGSVGTVQKFFSAGSSGALEDFAYSFQMAEAPP